MNWSWVLPESFSTFGTDIDRIYYVILWVTGITFVATEALLFYFVLRYRHKEGRKASYEHGSTKLEVAWTSVTLIIVVGIGLMSQGVWARVKMEIPPDAMELIVTAKQFEWNFTYPGPDGTLGSADDFVLRNEIHAYVGRPVHVHLRSEDVIHSFFLPQLRLKQDILPGKEISAWFEATEAGQYVLGCAELCGTGHTTMDGTLTVHASEAEYLAWARTQAR